MDESLINVLSDSQDLYQRRLKACSSIEEGFFAMALAQRQVGATRLRTENIREEITPAVRVIMYVGNTRDVIVPIALTGMLNQ